MRLYIDALTNFTNEDSLAIDYIEVQLKNGKTISIDWDESDSGIDDGLFLSRYKGVYFDDEYANDRINELKDMQVKEVGFYFETDKPLNFIITNMLFEDGDKELTFYTPFAMVNNEVLNLSPNSALNTKINYLYRDASNYKVENECVIKGVITEAQQKVILDCLESGEFFIPSQVGLPEKRFDGWTEDDHPWFELNKNDFQITQDTPTVALTVDELVNAFKEAKDNWHDTMDISNPSEILPLENRITSAKAVVPKEQVECIKTKNITSDQHLR